MAKINGVELKAIKTFKDHEGCSIAQGNVYIDGKKAGFWSQDSWGGSDSYDLAKKDMEILASRAKDFGEAFPNDKFGIHSDPDILMYTILELNQKEKVYKKYSKQGYSAVIMVDDGYHCCYRPLCQKHDADWETKFAKDIKEMKSQMFKNCKPNVSYVSGSDYFSAVIDSTHPAYNWMKTEQG